MPREGKRGQKPAPVKKPEVPETPKAVVVPEVPEVPEVDKKTVETLNTATPEKPLTIEVEDIAKLEGELDLDEDEDEDEDDGEEESESASTEGHRAPGIISIEDFLNATVTKGGSTTRTDVLAKMSLKDAFSLSELMAFTGKSRQRTRGIMIDLEKKGLVKGKKIQGALYYAKLPPKKKEA